MSGPIPINDRRHLPTMRAANGYSLFRAVCDQLPEVDRIGHRHLVGGDVWLSDGCREWVWSAQDGHVMPAEQWNAAGGES